VANDQVTLRRQASVTRSAAGTRTRGNGGPGAETGGGGPGLAVQGYARGASSGQHYSRVPSFGDTSNLLNYIPTDSPGDAQAAAGQRQAGKRGGTGKAATGNGVGSLKSLAVEGKEESMTLRRTTSMSRRQPQISTAEVASKPSQQQH